MKAFKAYDIRGVYNRDFNSEDVYKIGFFLPRLLDADRVLVGRDVRESSKEVFEALCRGINDAGADVYDMGLSTTPMVYFGTAHFNFDASVQITASHNPSEYNGLKVSRTGALPVGYYSGLSDLEKMMETEEVSPVDKKGRILAIDVKTSYVEFLKKYVPADLSQIDLSIDCSNGMAGLLIRELLGDAPHYLFESLDGTF